MADALTRTQPAPSFELKAAPFTMPLLRLLGVDMDALGAELAAKVEQASGFFRNTPIVIDLSPLPSGADVEFPRLVGILRGFGMIPVGVRGADENQKATAEAMELAILGDTRIRTEALEEPAPKPRGTGGRPVTLSGSLVITHPVRSGQRVYAEGGDLSIVGPVNSGAEVMADGNIHIYGRLRGRAMAGVSGNTEARIFCRSLEADLVSVAGQYRVSEGIPAKLKETSVQIYLEQDVLRIEKL